MTLRIERPKNLTEIARDHLRKAIIEGRLAFGEPLSELSISQVMGVSATPVRHAFALLRVEGLVEVVPQRGTFVFTPSRRELDDMAALRNALEPAALELAIHLDHGGLTSALDAVCSGMASACERGDMAICLQRDTEFHAQLFEFCGNDYLRNAYGLIAHKLAAIRTQMATRSDDRADCFAGHGKLLTAIQARKLQRAKALLREHLHEAHTFYRTNLDRIVAEAPRHYGHLPGLVLEHDAHRQPAPTSR